MSDSELLDFLDIRTNLHQQVECLYVVDGYEASVTYDGNVIAMAPGETYREAIAALAKAYADMDAQ